LFYRNEYNTDMIKRHLAKVIEDYSTYFPIVLLTGARQVGKSTLLNSILSSKGIKTITFDNIPERQLAENDPSLFFSLYFRADCSTTP